MCRRNRLVVIILTCGEVLVLVIVDIRIDFLFVLVRCILITLRLEHSNKVGEARVLVQHFFRRKRTDQVGSDCIYDFLPYFGIFESVGH